MIDIGVFTGCVSLREVKLPGGIQGIGRHAFGYCRSLERINFPSTLTAIGDRAFYSCTSLAELELVGGIQDIGVEAFLCCSSLERIAIPSKAFVIDKIAGYYSDCRLLADETFLPTNLGQVMIASTCFESMSLTGLVEVENAINNAINDDRDQSKKEVLVRIRALFPYYELEEATTILELALWKAKVDESDDLNARTREHYRVTCGAGITIRIFLLFL